MCITRRVSLIIFACLLASPAAADVKLPAVFNDHMVIQCDAKIPVWGWADAGEKVTVTLDDRTATATADADGTWKVSLDALKAGGPHVLKATGGNTVEIKDVLVGEVWLCSGQSNMAMQVSRAKDFDKEQAVADFPNIRMFTTARQSSPEPKTDCKGQWNGWPLETGGRR